jgi:hypothetical protein
LSISSSDTDNKVKCPCEILRFMLLPMRIDREPICAWWPGFRHWTHVQQARRGMHSLFQSSGLLLLHTFLDPNNL